MNKHHKSKSPRRRLTAAVLAAAVLLGVCPRPVHAAGDPPDEPQTVATGAMQNWLQELDENKYEQSWNEAGEVFQKAITVEGWTAALNKARTPLGKCLERKLASASRQTDLPSPTGAQTGEFILAQFDTSFEGMKYTVETVTFAKASDGTWKAVGYYVKPKV